MPNKINALVWIISATFLLLFPAFYNGFPLVYSDTGTYIMSGFEKIVPDDRPIFYGLFIRYSSLAYSLWFTVIAQSLIISSVLFYMVALLLKDHSFKLTVFFIVIFSLTIYSALPYVTNTIMPDIFTPVSFLLFLILLLNKDISLIGSIIITLLFIFFSLTHLSNIISFTVLCFCLVLLKSLFRSGFGVSFSKIFQVSMMVGSLWVILPAVNYSYGYGFKMNKASHVFLIGKFIDNGLLKDYLDHSPNAKTLKIYTYKDSLPANTGDFIWNPQSMLYKTGGWDKNKEEYNYIIKEILTSKRLFPKWVFRSIVETFTQLANNNFGMEFKPFLNENPSSQVAYWLNNDLKRYKDSRQNNGFLYIDFYEQSYRQNTLIAISLLVMLLYFIKNKLTTLKSMACFTTLLFVIANSFATAVFSCIVHRYNSRLSWIILMFAIIILSEYVLTIMTKLKKEYVR